MRTLQNLVIATLVLLAGCSTTSSSSYEGADFSASAQCRMQCQASYRSCMARDIGSGSRQSSCEQQMAPAPDKRCKDIEHPELRRSCELKAHDCTVREPMMGCGEQRDTCMRTCG